MYDITDEKGNIRPEFSDLNPEQWAALYHEGRLPSGHPEPAGLVNRLGDLNLATVVVPSAQRRRTEMPAPTVSLASVSIGATSPLFDPDRLGFFGKIGLRTAQVIGLDRVPLLIGAATVTIPILVLML